MNKMKIMIKVALFVFIFVLVSIVGACSANKNLSQEQTNMNGDISDTMLLIKQTSINMPAGMQDIGIAIRRTLNEILEEIPESSKIEISGISAPNFETTVVQHIRSNVEMILNQMNYELIDRSLLQTLIDEGIIQPENALLDTDKVIILEIQLVGGRRVPHALTMKLFIEAEL